MSGETTQAGPVTEDAIRQLVHAFYAKVRQDAELGPIFARVIGEEELLSIILKRRTSR